jgi:MinD-like ATPase involved in chromosome partitioning or flagellar assembly
MADSDGASFRLSSDPAPALSVAGGDGRLEPPPRRVVVALGDPERERQQLAALDEGHGFTITGRCLSADDLLPQLDLRPADIALLASDLHHFTRDVLDRLLTRVPAAVLLVPDSTDPSHWRRAGVTVLPLRTGPAAVGAALRGELPEPPVAEPEPEEAPQAASGVPVDSVLLAVTGGHGSPGRTTLAVNLAACLGVVAPTVLVDADLAAPSVAAQLDADPTRNLYMLAHAAPRSALEWDRALEQEVQPMGGYSRHGYLLCGLPKPEMRGRLGAAFFGQLLPELAQRYRYVVVDAGGGLDEAGGEAMRFAVQQASQVLVVATPDLVGLARARRALDVLRAYDDMAKRVAVVMNRHHRRHHSSRAELEWALEAGLAAIVPYDYHAAERAHIAQRPLVVERRSAAGRAVLDLAGRLRGGDILLPPEAKRPQRQPVRLVSRLPGRRSRPAGSAVEGAVDGRLAGAG